MEQNFVGKLPIEYLVDRTSLDVHPSLVNKGIVLKRSVSHNSCIDYILCVSDGKTGEDMFRSLEILQMGGTEVVQFAAIVGSPQRKTLANWRIETSEKFLDLLNSLVTT